MAPANADDAHRPLEKHHDLAAILSHVEKRRVNNDYTFPLDAKIYRIARKDICTGLRGAAMRVEQRRDGTVAARFPDRYLSIGECEQRPKVSACQSRPERKRRAKPAQRSKWNKNFDLKKAPKVWQAAQAVRRQDARNRNDGMRRHGVARRQSSPYTGKLSARPAGKPGGLLHR